MAVNQARIIEALEKAYQRERPNAFIYAFLEAYGFPDATITRLKSGSDSRNIGSGEDIGLKKKLYFRSVDSGRDVAQEAEINSVIKRSLTLGQ